MVHINYHGPMADVWPCCRTTNYLNTFPPTKPLRNPCMNLLCPIPRPAAGIDQVSIIVNSFFQVTWAVLRQRINAETIAAAFWDAGRRPTDPRRR